MPVWQLPKQLPAPHQHPLPQVFQISNVDHDHAHDDCDINDKDNSNDRAVVVNGDYMLAQALV